MENFLINFFHLSQIKSLLLLCFITCLFALLKFFKKKLKFYLIMAISLILGFALGYFLLYLADFPNEEISKFNSLNSLRWFYEIHIWMNFLNTLYISILRLLIIPLVFISLIHVLIHLDEKIQVKALFSRAFFWFLFSTGISACIGITIAIIANLGNNIALQSNSKNLHELKSLDEIILNLIPNNIISAMNSNNILGVIIFAFILSFGIRNLKENRGFRIFSLLTSFLHQVIMKISLYVIKIMPYFIITMIANALILNGYKVLIDSIYFIALLYVAFMAVFILHALLLLFHGLNPFIYYKKAFPALLMAFSSRSSAGTLPVTISTLTQNLGVTHTNASFVASLGTTMGMNGCSGYYAGMIAVFMFHALNIPIGMSEILTTVALCIIASFGIAGIPGITIMIISVMLSGLGMQSHFALLAVILAIDPILDMARTCSNVSGAMVVSLITDKEMKNLDIKKYQES
ncbi:dicarboxylate/amino acid:cation symporter [Campylobacter molothri]|nr:dicarboxylate/amino acid:cation symporter [Campylobacter sp. W0065]MBZ7967784.1 dicarboxylate/amino acid:cation symporter [Campylobacter sp. RM9756]